MPILMADGDFVRILPSAAGVFQRGGAPLGADEVEDRQAQHFVQCKSRQAVQCLVAIGDDAVAMEHDGLVRGLGELAHAFFALAYLTLGAPTLGDVGDQHKGAELQPRVAKMRDQVDLDHPHLAVGQGLLARVFHALTV